MSLRLAGLAAAVGGALWALFFIMAGNAYETGADYGLAWIALVLVAALVLLAALAGLSAAQFRVHPRTIWAAFLAPASGIAIIVIGLVIVLATGGAADEETVQARVLYAGLALMLIGSVVFALVTIATGALSRIAAGLVLGGVLPTTLGLFGAIGALWLVIGGIGFGFGWIGLGLDAIRRDGGPVSAGPAAA